MSRKSSSTRPCTRTSRPIGTGAAEADRRGRGELYPDGRALFRSSRSFRVDGVTWFPPSSYCRISRRIESS